MPTQKFAFERGGVERLELTWKGYYQDFTVSLDGSPLGVISPSGALRQANRFPLPDGSLLEIQLLRKWTGAELQVLRDGQPLPDSAGDPAGRVKLAGTLIYILAGLNLLLGGLARLGVGFFQSLAGDGIYALLLGAVFAILGVLVSRRSQLALLLAMGLYLFDGLLGAFASIEAGQSLNASGLLVRVIILVPLFQGLGALRQLQQTAPPRQ